MYLSIQRLAANLPLNGNGSLHSAIDSIEQLGSELIGLHAQVAEGRGGAFNCAVFKRRGIGNPPPGALHLSATAVPPLGNDVEIDPNNEHAGHVLVGASPVWVMGVRQFVSVWRG